MTVQHTPGPWKVGRYGEVLRGYHPITSLSVGWIGLAEVAESESDGTPEVKAKNQAQALANAAFIVLACNAHDELVAVCERASWALELLRERLSREAPSYTAGVDLLLGAMSAALANATPSPERATP